MAAKTTRDSNRRVAFPEAGQGVYALLRNSGVRELQSHYGKTHISTVDEAFRTADIEVIETLTTMMLWKGDASASLTFDDLDHISLQELVDKLRDAWSLSIHGRTYDEQLDYIQKRLAEMQEKGGEDPLTESPETSSTTSGDQPTGQD